MGRPEIGKGHAYSQGKLQDCYVDIRESGTRGSFCHVDRECQRQAGKHGRQRRKSKCFHLCIE